MTAIFTVPNGTAWDHSQLDQYASAFNGVFGVTDTNQVNLGRLAAPIATADPGGLSAGMLWLRTNLGPDGRWMTYKNGKTIPLIGVRQRVVSTATGVVSVNSTSYVDITGLTVNITTTGGRCRISIIPGPTAADFYWQILSGAAVLASGVVAALVDGALVAQNTLGVGGASGSLVNYYAAGSLVWETTPAAGAHTIKLQGKAASPGTMQLNNAVLVVEEWDE